MTLNIYPFLQDGVRLALDASYNCQLKLINLATDVNDYDDVVTQTVTGSSTISGLVFPINSKQGSTEAMMMEQGILVTTDKTLYINGTNSISASGLLIGIGSTFYTVIPNGISTYGVTGSNVYHKLYIRQTITGSLF